MPRPTLLSRTLRDTRAAHRLTQLGMADLIGVSERTVIRWENAEAIPYPSLLRRIEEVFELEPNSLVEMRRLQLRRRLSTVRRKSRNGGPS